MSTNGRTIREVMDSVISSDFVKKLKFSVNEANETIANMANKNKILSISGFEGPQKEMEKNIQEHLELSLGDGIGDMFFSSKENLTKANELTKKANTDNYKDIIDQISALSNSETALKENLNSGIEDILSTGTKITPDNVRTKLGANYYLNMPKAYFSNPDPKVRNARIKAVAGTYAGVAIGTRFLSGGSLTEDKYGNSDIVGIPFI